MNHIYNFCLRCRHRISGNPRLCSRCEKTMTYVVSILVENNNRERLRAFTNEAAARRHVERLAARLSRMCDKNKSGMFVALATIYFIKTSGHMRQVATFNGYDDGSGCWTGWEPEVEVAVK